MSDVSDMSDMSDMSAMSDVSDVCDMSDVSDMVRTTRRSFAFKYSNIQITRSGCVPGSGSGHGMGMAWERHGSGMANAPAVPLHLRSGARQAATLPPCQWMGRLTD